MTLKYLDGEAMEPDTLTNYHRGINKCHACWSSLILLFLISIHAVTSKERYRCEGLGDFNHGHIEMRDRYVGYSVTYVCEKGYHLHGNPTRTCLSGARWSGTAPYCKDVQCPVLKTPENGWLSSNKRSYESRVEVHCSSGFRYSKPESQRINCQGNNTWSGEIGQCIGIKCPELQPPKNGTVKLKDLSFGHVATFKCAEGFIYSLKTNSRECLENGSWSGEDGTCKPIKCPQFKVEHGNVSLSGGTYKEKATVICNPGFDYNKNSTIRICEKDERWTEENGLCIPIDCPSINEGTNANTSPKKGKFKDIVNRTCNEGYTIQGPKTIQCTINGNWSGELGTCVKDINLEESRDGISLSLQRTVEVLLPSILVLNVVIVVFLIFLYKDRQQSTCWRSRNNRQSHQQGRQQNNVNAGRNDDAGSSSVKHNAGSEEVQFNFPVNQHSEPAHA